MATGIGEIIRTRSSSEEWNIQWTIKDFFTLFGKKGLYTSPVFSIADFKWRFTLGVTARLEPTIGLTLMFAGERKRAIVSFGVKTAGGKVQRIGAEICHEFRLGSHIIAPEFLSLSELRQQASVLAPLGHLTITCDMRPPDESNRNQRKSISRSSRAKSLSTIRSSQAKPLEAGPERVEENQIVENLHLPQQTASDQNCPRTECPGQSLLCAKFKDMFLSKRFCDATLKVQDEEFLVHRGVLAVRSPVFAAIFEADQEEKQKGVIDIPDCHPDVFQVFLTYLYSGVTEDLSEHAFDLYRIATKFGVDELKRDCLHYILNNLKVDNLFEAAIFARQFGEQDLSRKVQDFFNENCEALMGHAKWSSFLEDHFALGNELLRNKPERN